MKRQSLYIIALSTLALAGCQKESAFHIEDDRDAVVRIEASIAKVSDNLTKSAVGTESQEGIALISANGSFTVPMTCETSEGIDLGGVSSQTSDDSYTKGTIYNETGSPESLGKYVSEFMVAAWNTPAGGDAKKVIPDAAASAFGSDYVSGGYQKVMKRTASDDSEYWMTVQPQTATVEGAPEKADDEYIWKSGESKTFYAYANLPASGATIANTASTGQTLTYTVPSKAVDQKDILMGFYKGDGKTDATGSEKMTGTASIKFEHPLTAVLFKQGTMTGVTGIKSITISGLAKSGSVTMGADGAMGSWTITGNDYTASVELSNGGNPLTVDSTTNLIGKDSEGNFNGAFLLIPQTLSATRKVTVTAVLVTGTGDVTVKADIASSTWEVGKTNTYTLGYTPEDSSLLPGVFSVSDSKTVNFTKGNLYWDGSAFNFEAKQSDVQSSWSSSHVSHFYYSKNANWAYASKLDEDGAKTDILFTNADINTPKADFTVNGVTGKFRALSKAEWEYLLNREVKFVTGKDKSYSLNITYGGKKGIVLYPDDYTGTALSGTVTNLPEGVVFLPPAGYRDEDDIKETSLWGYWSSESGNDSDEACSVLLDGNTFSINKEDGRQNGYCIRLVADCQ